MKIKIKEYQSKGMKKKKKKKKKKRLLMPKKLTTRQENALSQTQCTSHKKAYVRNEKANAWRKNIRSITQIAMSKVGK